LNVTLCDPEFELTPVLNTIIARANVSTDLSLESTDVFVGGHSVGGACARHFVDTQFAGPAGGVVFFGTQYTGDTENLMMGALGYPINLTSYTTPLLAITGELDMFSVDNIALTVQKWGQLPKSRRYTTYPMVVPGMDESSYSYPFSMGGDIKPESTQAASLQAVGEISGEWLDYVAGGPSSSTVKMDKAVATTKALTAPFLDALVADADYCRAQQLKLPGVPPGTEVHVVHVPGG
jgi:hypothetical protein